MGPFNSSHAHDKNCHCINARLLSADLSQEKTDQIFFRVSTPAGGKYIVSFAVLHNLIMDSRPDRFGLFAVFGRREGELENREHHLPIGMCDISPLSEPVPDTEPVGCATVEKPSERPDDHFDESYKVDGY